MVPQQQIQCHRHETILQLSERDITNYEAQIGVLALAPQSKNDSIVPRQVCNCTNDALRATLVYATGTVRLLISVWIECREMRINGAHYLRVQLLCCCQRESKPSRVVKLFFALEKITEWNRHRNENVRTSPMPMQPTSMRAC